MIHVNRLTKLWAVSLAATVVLSGSVLSIPSLAVQPVVSASGAGQRLQSAPSQVPKALEQNIKQALSEVYGPKQVSVMYPEILRILNSGLAERSPQLKQQDLSRPSDWYKDEVVYMFYADRFGLHDGEKTTTFKDTIGLLTYLKTLGVSTLYILPFMDSPMGDAGFDVRDYTKVRADLGGNTEFQAFVKAARAQGFKIQSDLILNHISDQHPWFQAALKGDKAKMQYFIGTPKLPPYKEYRDPQKGVVVDYTEPDGKISSRRLIFPDIARNHYREVSINGKPYYFYHTFYPFQLDVNWKNPQVLYEVLRIMNHWSNLGVDVFRVDAIPFFIKEPGTDGENRPQTYSLVKLLSSYLQALSPRSVILAEACQWPKDILPYFGHDETYKTTILNKPKIITRTDKTQIAYNFPFMPAIWASLITEDKSHFWQAFAQTPKIPDSASWAVFLRVHDELTLEMVSPETRKIVYDALEPKGAEFRKGLGVSGRMANFLDKDPAHINLAFSVLMSLPGVPVIYYGDEIGALNDFDYAKAYAEQREATQNKQNKNQKMDVLSYFDSRDINRGPIDKDTFYAALQHSGQPDGEVFTHLQTLIKIRRNNPVLTHGTISEVGSDQPGVFAYLRSMGQHNILIVNNLSGKESTSTLTLPADIARTVSSQSSLNDLQRGQPVEIKNNDGKVTLTLKPYQAVWLAI